MYRKFLVGPFEIEVALEESREWNGPSQEEIRTTVNCLVESQLVTYSVSEMVNPYATWQETEQHFNAVCDKWRFTERGNK